MTDGDSSHHQNVIPMKFKMNDGSFTSTDRETASVLSQHFCKIYNRSTSVDWEFIESIPSNLTFHDISSPMTLEDLNNAINKLTWHKAPGRNGVSPNAIKALDQPHHLILLQFIHQWMDNPSITFNDWKIATVTPSTKGRRPS